MPGDIEAVLGPGPIRLLVLLALKAAAAANVIVTSTGVNKRKSEIARSLGAELSISRKKVLYKLQKI